MRLVFHLGACVLRNSPRSEPFKCLLNKATKGFGQVKQPRDGILRGIIVVCEDRSIAGMGGETFCTAGLN